MSTISIPIERIVFGNEHWRSYRAIDEIEVYCDILGNLQTRIDSLETRYKDEGFCQNSGLSRHGGKLTQKLGPG